MKILSCYFSFSSFILVISIWFSKGKYKILLWSSQEYQILQATHIEIILNSTFSPWELQKGACSQQIWLILAPGGKVR